MTIPTMTVSTLNLASISAFSSANRAAKKRYLSSLPKLNNLPQYLKDSRHPLLARLISRHMTRYALYKIRIREQDLHSRCNVLSYTRRR